MRFKISLPFKIRALRVSRLLSYFSVRTRIIVLALVPLAGFLANGLTYISGEEEKLEAEPNKILGKLHAGMVTAANLRISAQCHRVPVSDGHLEAVSLKLRTKASPEDVAATLREFRGEAQRLELPSAPAKPIEVRDEPDRPQPRLDRGAGDGMIVVIGRIRRCPVLDIRLDLLSHNLVRGAAGAAILNAELLVSAGYITQSHVAGQGRSRANKSSTTHASN